MANKCDERDESSEWGGQYLLYIIPWISSRPWGNERKDVKGGPAHLFSNYRPTKDQFRSI